MILNKLYKLRVNIGTSLELSFLKAPDIYFIHNIQIIWYYKRKLYLIIMYFN